MLRAKAQHPAANAWILLAVFYIASVIMLWPGVMSLDASAQYSMAMSGVYTDHHPPMMSFVWRYLAHIYPGPAPMFLLHISMLYAAAAIFIYIFRQTKFKWWYAVYPLLPNLVAYTALIVKDTGFTYSYLLATAILSCLTISNQQKYKLVMLMFATLLLFYGTAVKFQAQYILIFFTLGIGYCLCNFKFNFKSVAYGILLYAAIMAAVTATNATLVPAGKGSYSWQFVKIYDLSAISIAVDHPLYPDFILQQQDFNFARVKELFTPREVDPLVFHNRIIYQGENTEQRDALWDYWFKTVTRHPILYLQARLKLFSYDLTTSPCERNNPVQFFATTSLEPLLAIPGLGHAIDAGYMVFKVGLRFMWLLPLLFVYLYLGIANFRTSRAAAPLLMACCSSLALLLVLLFCSMAGTARYVFLCSCLMHAAHGMAYLVWREAYSYDVKWGKLVQRRT